MRGFPLAIIKRIKLKFEGKYKSINKIEWNDIPKSLVITGENGTGKSQLLDIINTV